MLGGASYALPHHPYASAHYGTPSPQCCARLLWGWLFLWHFWVIGVYFFWVVALACDRARGLFELIGLRPFPKQRLVLMVCPSLKVASSTLLQLRFLLISV